MGTCALNLVLLVPMVVSGRRLLQQDNELPLCGCWTVNSFAKPARLWCN